MSTFLDKFIGKTQIISKLGPEQLFRGKEDNIVYTKTNKSFARSSTHQQVSPHNFLRQSESGEEEAPFHLPHLQSRYIQEQPRKGKQFNSHHYNSRVYFDKETNWLIEQSEFEPIIKEPYQNRPIASVDAQKQNKGRGRQNQERRLKSHQLQKSTSRVGGLGANIGGEQWLIKKQKQQKIKRYADELKRTKRLKQSKESGETKCTMIGGVLINN